MIEIREATIEDKQVVCEFLYNTMTNVYPFPLTDTSFNDLKEMESYYINKDNAKLFIAFSNHEVIGTIAIRPYDGRIVEVKNRYDLNKTCEVIKCYISENIRRKGIGSLLFKKAEQFCRDTGYVKIYLHTHRFLPGGLYFWLKKGFTITIDQIDEIETVHMEKEIL